MSLLNCNETQPLKLQINLDGKIYACDKIHNIVYAKRTSNNLSTGESESSVLDCSNKGYTAGLYCRNSILFSINDIVCDSTTTTQKIEDFDEKHTILHCYWIFE